MAWASAVPGNGLGQGPDVKSTGGKEKPSRDQVNTVLPEENKVTKKRREKTQSQILMLILINAVNCFH